MQPSCNSLIPDGSIIFPLMNDRRSSSCVPHTTAMMNHAQATEPDYRPQECLSSIRSEERPTAERIPPTSCSTLTFRNLKPCLLCWKPIFPKPSSYHQFRAQSLGNMKRWRKEGAWAHKIEPLPSSFKNISHSLTHVNGLLANRKSVDKTHHTYHRMTVLLEYLLIQVLFYTTRLILATILHLTHPREMNNTALTELP